MRTREGYHFVTKRLPLTGITQRELQRVEEEVQTCARLRHPNIIHYLATSIRRERRDDEQLLICLEYASGGTLASRIDQHLERDEPFTEETATRWIGQIASAVSYIHSQRVMHRDLSAHNIFLSRAADVKVGDFGLSKSSDGLQSSVRAHTLCGTPIYFSPEMVNGEPYGAPSDAWAVGVLAHEILTLRHPFLGLSLAHLLRRIAACEYDRSLLARAPYSDELKACSTDLLHLAPATRLTLGALLSRPLLAELAGKGAGEQGDGLEGGEAR